MSKNMLKETLQWLSINISDSVIDKIYKQINPLDLIDECTEYNARVIHQFYAGIIA